MNKVRNVIVPMKKELSVGRFLIPCRIYESDGPQLICVNGVQQSMAMWLSFVNRFSKNYHIVLFDFPNQGKGKILSGLTQVTLDEQVDILGAVMSAAGLGKDTTINAASWGGVVAAAFAAKYPEKLKRLNLASLSVKPNKQMVETIQKSANIPVDDREKMADTLVKSFGQALPPRAQEEIFRQFRTMAKDQIKAFYEHGLFVISSKQLNEIVDLHTIKALTTILHGENDTIIDLNDVKFLAAQIPHCELRIIKGVGHFMHMENDHVLDIYEDILLSQ